jgi:hypothetical protein
VTSLHQNEKLDIFPPTSRKRFKSATGENVIKFQEAFGMRAKNQFTAYNTWKRTRLGIRGSSKKE